MNCTNCGTYNEPGAKYCIKCGNPLASDANNVELLDTEVKNSDVSSEEPVLISQSPVDNSANEQGAVDILQESSASNNTSQTMQNSTLADETETKASLNEANLTVLGGENNSSVEQGETNSEILQDNVSTQTTQQIGSNISEKKVGNKFNYVKYLIAVLLRPKQAYKDEENNLNEPKNSIILALIISVVMTVLGFIQTIISTVRVAQYDFADGGYSYTWQFDNLKNIKFIQLIGKNFFIDFCIILAIAGAFYLGSLVIKKQISFIKNISLTATAMVPVVVGAMFLAPIVSLIWSPLSFIFVVLGGIYSFLIFYELMNDYLQLEGDKKIWFNSACISVLLIVVYYFLIKTLISSI